MLGAAPWLGRFCLRWPGLVVFAVVIALSALLSGIAATQNPNEPTDQWVDDGGTVKVEQTTLTIREGESQSYRLRLNRQPLEDGWWVMVLVDGAKRYDGLYDKDGDLEDDISWMPSVGWQVDVTNDMNALAATPWRNITITAKQDADTEDQTITFAHELWDHNTYCPQDLHPSGTPLAMVTVHIIDDDIIDDDIIDDDIIDDDTIDDDTIDDDTIDDDTGSNNNNNNNNNNNDGNYLNTNTDGGTDGNNCGFLRT